MILKTKEDFLNLKIGQKIYKSSNRIHDYYFAGISPVSEKMSMLINCDRISDMSTVYIPLLCEKNALRLDEKPIFTDSYEEAKIHMLRYMERELSQYKRRFFSEYTKSDWRNFNIENIIEF